MDAIIHRGLTRHQLMALAFPFAVVALAFTLFNAPKNGASLPAPRLFEPLDITVASGPSGFAFTNRERRLTQCLVAADDGFFEWIARVSEDIAPYQSVHVPWSQFSHSGAPMPAYLGRSALVTLNCDTGEGRRFATMKLRQ
jgi:hypothetical protein